MPTAASHCVLRGLLHIQPSSSTTVTKDTSPLSPYLLALPNLRSTQKVKSLQSLSTKQRASPQPGCPPRASPGKHEGKPLPGYGYSFLSVPGSAIHDRSNRKNAVTNYRCPCESPFSISEAVQVGQRVVWEKAENCGALLATLRGRLQRSPLREIKG